MTPQEYFDRIQALRTPEEIKIVVDELTKTLFNATDKPKTRLNKLSHYRKLIDQITDLVEGENAYIQIKKDGSQWKRHLHFRFTGVEEINFNGVGGINDKKIVTDRLENLQEIPVDDYLKTTEQLLKSDDIHELTIGLIAASGRRPIEILARGSFTLCEDLPKHLKPGYFVNFKGQAKKRDSKVAEDEKQEYRIGVLFPAKSFLEAFDRYKSLPEALELSKFIESETEKGIDAETINASIDNKRGQSLRRVTQRNFLTLPKRKTDKELNPKALRAVYVALITERDCPKNINKLLWASRAVGHFVDSTKANDSELRHLVTTLGYSDYYIDQPVPFTSEIEIKKPVIATVEKQITPTEKPSNKVVTVRVNADALDRIRNLQTEWELPNQQAVIDKLIELLDNPKEVVKNTVQKEKIERNLEGLTDLELRFLRGDDAVEEKIRRAFQRVCNYNDMQPDNSTRRFISGKILIEVSGCNGKLVSKWVDKYADSIASHNGKYSLTEVHNRLHTKIDISSLKIQKQI